MQENIYDTLKGILWSELPKNGQGIPVVRDKMVTAWKIGERDVQNKTPGFEFQAETSDPVEVATASYEIEHHMRIKTFTQGLEPKETEGIGMEMARLLRAILVKHRTIWVCTRCVFCGSIILTPEQYLLEHSDVLGSYATAVLSDFDAFWQSTHPVSIPTPTLHDANVATDAYYRLYEDVRNNTVDVSVPLTTEARDRILHTQALDMRPIRECYMGHFSQVKPTSGERGTQLLTEGEFTFVLKELEQNPDGGPNNVPTQAVTPRWRV